jgi:multiple sugar transport system substrate-binding protein
MGAPISQLFTSQAIGSPTYAMKDGKLGIMIGANWMPEIWAVAGTRYWPTAAKHVAAVAMPTEFGQAPGTVSEMSGWAYAVSKAAPNEALAWDLVKMNMEAQNQLDVAEWSGFVPPDPAVANSKANLAFGGGFNGAFNTFVDHSVSLPNNPNLTVYAQGMNTATGDIAQYPKSTSVKDAVSALDQVVTQQLGPNSTEK